MEPKATSCSQQPSAQFHPQWKKSSPHPRLRSVFHFFYTYVLKPIVALRTIRQHFVSISGLRVIPPLMSVSFCQYLLKSTKNGSLLPHKNLESCLRSEVLRVVDFSGSTPRTLVGSYQRFGRTCRVHMHG
jgi:hypothetical protein